MAGGIAMIRWLVLAFLAAGGTALAAGSHASDIDPARFSYQERPGARLPGQLLFRDSDGQAVRLADLAQGVPLILVPAYLRCPNLCGVVRASLLGTLQRADLHAGRDYVLAVLSIDPTETSAEASAAKANDLSAFGGGGDASSLALFDRPRRPTSPRSLRPSGSVVVSIPRVSNSFTPPESYS